MPLSRTMVPSNRPYGVRWGIVSWNANVWGWVARSVRLSDCDSMETSDAVKDLVKTVYDLIETLDEIGAIDDIPTYHHTVFTTVIVIIRVIVYWTGILIIFLVLMHDSPLYKWNPRF